MATDNEKTTSVLEKNAMSGWEKWLRTSPNNFSYWFPHIKGLENMGVSIPRSEIIPLSMDIVKAFFMEEKGDKEKISGWIHKTVVPVLKTKFPKEKVFIKNGCYSGKFRFAENCLIEDPDDKETLVRNICNIQYDSLCLDKCGNLELVIREFIGPEDDTPTIYHGMPLRPEIRIFYDFDRHRYLYAANYWDWNECHDGICRHEEDARIYENYYPTLKGKMGSRLVRHLPTIIKALDSIDGLRMPGDQPNIWSVDFILEENRIWLIDMAVAWQSAYWDKERAEGLL